MNAKLKYENREKRFLGTLNESLITDREYNYGEGAVSVTNRRDFASPDSDKRFWRCATNSLKQRINHQRCRLRCLGRGSPPKSAKENASRDMTRDDRGLAQLIQR